MNKSGLAPVEMSIVINGQRCFINTSLKCSPIEFRKKRATKFAKYLANIMARVENYIMEISISGLPLTAESLREIIRTGGVQNYTVQNLFDDVMKLNENMTCENYSKYTKVRDLFYTILDKNRPVTDITNSVVRQFQQVASQLYKPATVASKMTKLKYFVKYALDNDKIHINPFSNIKIKKEKPSIEYLTEEELNKIIHFDTDIERLERIKDLFVFASGSGLSFTDLQHIEPEDIKKDGDTYYIQKERQKTGIEYTAVLLPFAVKIGEKYNWNLPKITNQKYNGFLKELQCLCGIEKSIHSHLARKTYLTLLLNRGVRADVVAKCAGHVNSRITLAVYAHMQRNTIINEVSDAIREYSAKK